MMMSNRQFVLLTVSKEFDLFQVLVFEFGAGKYYIPDVELAILSLSGIVKNITHVSK
jgi:hypothetical protein